jgi:hypothetical protein
LQKVMSRYFLILMLICFPFVLFGQSAGREQNPAAGNVFGRIYSGGYYTLDKNSIDYPQKGFDFTTGIIGYSGVINPKLKATLMYDVTRTTNFTWPDTTAINGYFEGSKYTAFLKMAQVDWNFLPGFTLSAGQLLNQQFLTLQDGWWGYRFVRVTFQESYRYGMPADFGLRITWKPYDNLSLSAGMVNGDGPFRYQDKEGDLLYSFNAELIPFNHFIFKVYGDFEESTNGEPRKTVSLFAGFRESQDKMFGLEWNHLENASFIRGNDKTGWSIYGSYKVIPKTRLLGRLDFGDLLMSENSDTERFYLLGGVDFEPAPGYNIVFTYRCFSFTKGQNIPQIYLNFGAKF